MDIAPLINGTRHSWASIRVNQYGHTFIGITGISYSDTTNKVNEYGAGNMPTDRKIGNYEAKASITLKMYEVDALLKAAGVTRLQDLPMTDITVAFASSTDPMRTDVIRNVEFKENKRETKQGDTSMEAELELLPSHIDWNI